MRTSMVGTNFSYIPGQEIEVKDEVAKAWVEAGIAEIVVETPQNSTRKKKKQDSED
jgi:hypothetical protein